jgi:hypothetical protein
VIRPRLPLAGEIVWDGPAPDPPLTAKVRVYIESLIRTERGTAETTIPSKFEFPNGVLLDEYRAQVLNLPKDTYIKEMTYGDRSILYEPLRFGTATGAGDLRIVLARDGGGISARAQDKDGKPIADCSVVVFPTNVSSESMLAAAMVTGKTDLTGAWTSPSMLAPGKYRVFATEDLVNRSIETIAKLWAMRPRLQEVSVGAGGSGTTTLSLTRIE